MSIAWDKRNKRWRFYFDRTIAGVRARSSRLLPKGWSAAQARAYSEREEGSLYAVASGIERPDDRPLISRAVELYVTYRAPELIDGKKSIQNLALLYEWYEGRSLPEIPEVARQFRADNPDLAPATLKNRLAALKAAVRYAYKRHNVGDRDYSERMEMPSVRNERHEYVEVDDFHRGLEAVEDAQAAAVLTLAFYTGLRWRANIRPLTQSQIVRKGRDVWLLIPRTKNDAPLMLPVHENARSALEAIPFTVSEQKVYAAFRALRGRLRRPGLHIHDLRHSLASALVSSGATLPEVGAMLGHKAVQSTKRYAHLYPQRVAEIVGRIGVREILTGYGKK
jgi:integrase